jgi:hypothetical protein
MAATGRGFQKPEERAFAYRDVSSALARLTVNFKASSERTVIS